MRMEKIQWRKNITMENTVSNDGKHYIGKNITMKIPDNGNAV